MVMKAIDVRSHISDVLCQRKADLSLRLSVRRDLLILWLSIVAVTLVLGWLLLILSRQSAGLQIAHARQLSSTSCQALQRGAARARQQLLSANNESPDTIKHPLHDTRVAVLKGIAGAHDGSKLSNVELTLLSSVWLPGFFEFGDGHVVSSHHHVQRASQARRDPERISVFSDVFTAPLGVLLPQVALKPLVRLPSRGLCQAH